MKEECNIVYFLELLKIGICLYIVKVIYDKINILKIKEKSEVVVNTDIYKLIKYKILEFSKSYNLKFLNVTLFISISSFLFIISYIFFYNIFETVMPSIIISLIFSTFPYSIINSMLKKSKNEILKNFPVYVLGLKSYTDVDNNIIYAFSQSIPNENIKRYIDKFNTSVLSGVNVYSAFETLKKDINIKQITQFISLLQNCYLNGGSFSKVIEEYAKFQTKFNTQKEKDLQDLYSSKITLIVLVILSLFMIFGFVLSNEVYKDIILNSVGGKIILTLNMLTFFFIYIIYLKICKMEG